MFVNVGDAYDLEFHRRVHCLRRSSYGWHDVRRHIALAAEPAATLGSRSLSPSVCPILDYPIDDPIAHPIVCLIVDPIDCPIADYDCTQASPKP